jgi:hypothetical protein
LRQDIRAATPGARVLFHHLDANSPWRRFMSSQNAPPSWPDMRLLWLKGAPRLGPFSMERGAQAYEYSRDAARKALREPACTSRV